jgi:hypothetical protein
MCEGLGSISSRKMKREFSKQAYIITNGTFMQRGQQDVNSTGNLKHIMYLFQCHHTNLKPEIVQSKRVSICSLGN